MRRTAATLLATAGLLVGSVGQASAVGSWSEEPVPTSAKSGMLTAAGSAAGESWAFGFNSDSSPNETSEVYRKDEQGWQQVPIENFGRLVDGEVLAPDDVWTVGVPTKTKPGGMAHWDGQTWTRVDPAPGTSPDPVALKAFAADDVWAVGGAGRGTAQHWDGRAWTDVPVPDLAEHDYESWKLTDVEGVASNDLWAVGYSTWPNGSRTIALHWDGRAWTEVPVPDVDEDPGVIEALDNVLALAPDDVWVGGHRTVQGQEVPFTAHWDGRAWETFELGEAGTITQLLQVGDQVQLFGVGPNAEPFRLGWDGAGWQGLIAPPMVRVYGAAVQDDGTVFGVGNRTGEGAAFEPYTATYRE
ncbi:hypothetical protein OU415_32235 [Saccharopolyspora sp. WRP15-2]|uniref:Uncharacterized protein n=1 Tax=Saccharopolyspora oryzae TaxID=2997343 RepID=A0ABT4V9P5_9PSEU|nr:hypothetical protein [Saccharopolyspora oryzae]MDA3630136.1 hypothetical protein [Saccharopolyspora oryzae]